MKACLQPCPQIRRQRGSALLLVLIFMAVLARMALSGVDAALLGTSLALNYRDHDRAFHSAEALLVALDLSLLARIESGGLQVISDTLPIAGKEVLMFPGADDHTGNAVLRYQVDATGFSFDVQPASDAVAIVCGPLYQVSVSASGVRPGTLVHLGLERRVCCEDESGCVSGDFVSVSRDWHWQHES